MADMMENDEPGGGAPVELLVSHRFVEDV